MRKIKVDPAKIYGFMHNENRGRKLLEYVQRYGWSQIPRVPVFEIPEELRDDSNYEFTLIGDGNCRRNAAEFLGRRLKVIVYESDENIDIERDRLAHSRHLFNPRRFDIAMQIFLNRDRLALI